MSHEIYRACWKPIFGRILTALYLALGVPNGVQSQVPVYGYVQSAGSYSSSAPFRQQANIPAIRWSPEHRHSLSGVLISIWTFDTSASLVDTARELATQTDYFQRVLVQGNVLVLSGLNEGRHWLAEFHSSSSGTSGRISGLSIDGRTRGPDNAISFTPFDNDRVPDRPPAPSSDAVRPQWRPPWGSVVFSVESLGQGEPSLTILHFFGPAETGHERVNDYLLKNGWTAAKEPGIKDVWLKQSSRLKLFFDCAGASCSLLGYLQPPST